MRTLLILVLAALAAVAQTPTVRLTNAARPTSTDFQIGERFEIVVTGAANQPVSVRTTMNGRMDWGPIIGRTDVSGRWSTTGQFEKSDFGDRSEVWTVGGKLANPVVHFLVSAPCLKGGESMVEVMSLWRAETCDTAEGGQKFATQSATEPFRTRDGRVIPGRIRSDMTAEQYHAEIMPSLIAGRARGLKSGQLGDQAGALIAKVIGANALDEDETRNVLLIIRAAFEKPDRIPPAAKHPSGTLLLLRNLADGTEQESLKQQIAETMAYVKAQ